jgi:hypothetical protein
VSSRENLPTVELPIVTQGRARARATRGAVVVFVLLTALVLAATPTGSGGELRDPVQCEVLAPVGDWIAGIANPRNLVVYAAMMLAAVRMFRERAVPRAATLVLALSVVVELEQAVFAEGDCRVRDLLPNALAVGGVAALWRWVIRP